jgi:hypothetical protein
VRNGSVRNQRAAAADDDEHFDLSKGLLGQLVMRVVTRNPRDSFIAIIAAGAVAAIFINGLFLQPGPHPAPIFTVRPSPVAANESTGTVVTVLPRPRPTQAESAPPTMMRVPVKAPIPPRASASKDDAITSVLVPSPQVLAIQRALNDFGYGPLKLTGIYDADTRAGVERFERARNLPVTGQISERLRRELADMTGRSLD